MYLKNNQNKTPYDFLIEKINELQDLIKELNNWSEDEEKKKLLKDKRPTYINSENLKRWINDNLNRKKQSIENNLKTFEGNLSFLNLKLLTTPKPNKTESTKSLLLQGKQLNLLERFMIADDVLDIDKKIRTLNISDTEKYKLLGYVLGCNETNARHIMNGKYKAKIRETVLKNYLSTLHGLN
jgi:hypothetical protein